MAYFSSIPSTSDTVAMACLFDLTERGREVWETPVLGLRLPMLTLPIRNDGGDKNCGCGWRRLRERRGERDVVDERIRTGEGSQRTSVFE